MNRREIMYSAVKALPYVAILLISSTLLFLFTPEKINGHCLPPCFFYIPVLFCISPIFLFLLKKYPYIPGIIWGIIVPILAFFSSNYKNDPWVLVPIILFPIGVWAFTYYYHKKMYDEMENNKQTLKTSLTLFFIISFIAIISTVIFLSVI